MHAGILVLVALLPLAAADVLHRECVVPYRDSVPLGELLEPISAELGWPEGLVRQLRIGIAPEILDDTLTSLTIDLLSDKAIAMRVEAHQVVVTIDRLRLRRSRTRAFESLRRFVERIAPAEAALLSSQHGLFVIEAAGAVPLAQAPVGKHLAVLVHGLDEPGRCWDTTIAGLRAQGMAVATFHYANDQGILDSAAELAAALRLAAAQHCTRVDLVGHSMGGLIIRAVVIDPGAYANRATAAGLPTVRRIITVGTPHLGSPMARFRFAAEARDQLAQWFSGKGLVFGAILDGSGEAQLDLVPGSVVLDLLNSRPLPEGIAITTIAGDGSPIRTEAIQARLTDWGPGMTVGVDGLADTLAAISAGHGDGAVALASARWAGVEDHHVVHANHVGMLHPEFPGDPEEPPAVPIILRTLGQP